MPCDCNHLPDVIKVSDEAGFVSRMEGLEIANWEMLCRCSVCGEHWKVDGWDGREVQFAFRIPDPLQWRAFDDTPLRKAYLLVSRGGLTGETCAWAGCAGLRVHGVALCVDHLYGTGARQ